MKNMTEWFLTTWRSLVFFVCLALAACSLLWFRLLALAPSISHQESATIAAAAHLQNFLQDPFFASYRIVMYLLHQAQFDDIWMMRSVSVVCGLLVLLLMYRILRTWYSVRIALLGTALFAFSSWFLHISRLAIPNVMYFGGLALVWCGLRTRVRTWRNYTLLLCTIIACLLLYVPGLIWFVIGLILWQRKTIAREIRRASMPMAHLVGATVVIVLAPLCYSLFLHPMLLLTLFALPEHLPSLSAFMSQLGHVPVWLFWQGPTNHTFWLARAPIFDVFTDAMLVLGVSRLVHDIKLDRVILIAGILLGGWILIALNGPELLSLIIPFLYLLATAGIALLLDQWFAVFPKNPIARGVGITLLSIAVAVSCLYHVNHYFVMWPEYATKQVSIQN